MAIPEKDHSSTLTRRRFVQGVAAVGIARAEVRRPAKDIVLESRLPGSEIG